MTYSQHLIPTPTSTSTFSFYRLQQSCGKVMFSQVSIILSMGGVWQTPPWADTAPWADTNRADGYCSRQYASYWYAFLLIYLFHTNTAQKCVKNVMTPNQFMYQNQILDGVVNQNIFMLSKPPLGWCHKVF